MSYYLLNLLRSWIMKNMMLLVTTQVIHVTATILVHLIQSMERYQLQFPEIEMGISNSKQFQHMIVELIVSRSLFCNYTPTLELTLILLPDF